MAIALQTDLCHALRASGLPKDLSHQLLNTYVKWINNSGIEWTNQRIKGIKQWYETHLAGNPVPVPYMKHNKSNLPTGVFGRLFRMRNQQKVLAALSVNTLFKVKGPALLESQRKKVLDGFKGNPEVPKQLAANSEDMAKLGEFHRKILWDHAQEEFVKENPGRHFYFGPPKTYHLGRLTPVTLEDMTGLSIPVSDNKILHPQVGPYSIKEIDRLRKEWDNPDHPPVMSFKSFLERQHEADHQASLRNALLESWRAIPACVVWLLDHYDALDMLPTNYLDFYGQAPRIHPEGRPIGKLGIIQEPALKPRTIFNPNRVVQHFSEPFAEFIRRNARDLPGNCCEDQDQGVRWIQDKLRAGVEIVCFDLTSATDLLDMDISLELTRAWCIQSVSPNDEDQHERYDLYEEFFRRTCRGDWWTPEGSGLPTRIRLCQGQSMGERPSFDVLQTTNCCAGIIASIQSGEDPNDTFVACGDDFACTAAIADKYEHFIVSMGGKINSEKTLRSNRCAEFAGRVITRERVMRKTIKFREPGDDSFMEYVTGLGPQAVSILRPRQRKVWEQFKYVPGIAYPGPWNPNSEGEPLEKRVAWAEQTHLFDEAEDPDPSIRNWEQQKLATVLEAAGREATSPDEIRKDLPWELDSGIQPEMISYNKANTKGDPRLVKGMTTLERLEREIRRPDFTRYATFNMEPSPASSPGEEMTGAQEDGKHPPMVPKTSSMGQVGTESADVAQTEPPCGADRSREPAKARTISEEKDCIPPPRGPVSRCHHDLSGLDIDVPREGDTHQYPGL